MIKKNSNSKRYRITLFYFAANYNSRLIFLLFPVLLASCSSMYISSVKTIPLFENKHEGLVEAGINSTGIYTAAAYTITNKYALGLNGLLSMHNFIEDRSFDQPNMFINRYIEGSLGRYNLLNLSGWKMEIFAGYGYGYSLNADATYYDNIKMPRCESFYHLGFLQLNYGWRWKFLEVGCSLRGAFTNFDMNYDDPYKIESLHKNFNNLHIEPTLFFRGGSQRLKVTYKMGYNHAWTLTDISEINMPFGIENGKWKYTPIHFSVGLCYRF
ncbi:MAG: hypothetical protein JXQ69_00650 [Paludibacteraceae bacterium]|nr:hypothetical protein [Paludibacteraceae bacterium]MBN2786806.1 hypothetical protein [Paludibacteraceae bacterium]